MNNNFNNEKFSWYVTGITDGDGGFFVGIIKSTNSIGWSIRLIYSLTASNNQANYLMLLRINEYFGNIGRIVLENTSNVFRLEIHGLKNCLIVRDHFFKYPLLTYKLVYFQLWSLIIDLMLNKKHLTREGLLLIVALKALFPKGLSNLLITYFSDYNPVTLPNYSPDIKSLNIFWIAGFINADGGFFLPICKSNTHKLGEVCRPSIQIAQHISSIIVLEGINKYFDFGNIYYKIDKTCEFRIGSLQGINNFINKFNEANLLGAKALDYIDFCKGINIMNKGEHLTKEGLEELRLISMGMNSKRTKFE
jgi:hypothetical protein